MTDVEDGPAESASHPGPSKRRPLPRERTRASASVTDWYRSAELPRLTIGVFLVFALALWLNAAVNHYRFNVALALLGSLPLVVLLTRGARTARAAARGAGPDGHAVAGPRRLPAGDVDYETGGANYARQRQTDPRIAALVLAALADARTVVNVGAGSGSYEPDDRQVVAVEPSAAMRSQRPAERVAAIDATAESLPFADDSFDAAMATVTIHQWRDAAQGLRELRRVSRGPVVVLTFDGDALDRFWLADYVPELIEAERRRYPSVAQVCDVLGGVREVLEVPIPIDCVDGFTEAFYARPEQFLDPAVRQSQSAWGFVEPAAAARGVEALRIDLDSGAWDQRYGALRSEPFFLGSLRLIVAQPDPDRPRPGPD